MCRCQQSVRAGCAGLRCSPAAACRASCLRPAGIQKAVSNKSMFSACLWMTALMLYKLFQTTHLCSPQMKEVQLLEDGHVDQRGRPHLSSRQHSRGCDATRRRGFLPSRDEWARGSVWALGSPRDLHLAYVRRWPLSVVAFFPWAGGVPLATLWDIHTSGQNVWNSRETFWLWLEAPELLVPFLSGSCSNVDSINNNMAATSPQTMKLISCWIILLWFFHLAVILSKSCQLQSLGSELIS